MTLVGEILGFADQGPSPGSAREFGLGVCFDEAGWGFCLKNVGCRFESAQASRADQGPRLGRPGAWASRRFFKTGGLFGLGPECVCVCVWRTLRFVVPLAVPLLLLC